MRFSIPITYHCEMCPKEETFQTPVTMINRVVEITEKGTGLAPIKTLLQERGWGLRRFQDGSTPLHEYPKYSYKALCPRCLDKNDGMNALKEVNDE